ncbi:GlcG/HbpS family heme-binding protein [Novosphingobium humi]|uniref:Heme-binding protein n=1 Tax=Novosphingobium humi TaxID=2282397 RepID=A0ABY7U0U6_9SPHN|nr:heme-binding protein [Novosphingobium humi]WCT79147.1 heme-binding protein [Novosphingobium humi]
MAGRSITLEQAQAVVAAALKEGRAQNYQPLTVAVLDPGGHLLAFAREDNSSNLRPQIAIAKAAGALALGLPTRILGEMAAERPTFINALSTISPVGVVPAAGGLLIYNAESEVVGAIGVTGDISDNDELCAKAGIAALTF